MEGDKSIKIHTFIKITLNNLARHLLQEEIFCQEVEVFALSQQENLTLFADGLGTAEESGLSLEVPERGRGETPAESC